MHTSTCAIRIPLSASRATSASFVRRTAAAEKCPFAGPGWFVAIAKTNPASREQAEPVENLARGES